MTKRLLLASALFLGCTHNPVPEVSPEEVPHLSAKIHSSVTFVPIPEFYDFVFVTTSGIHSIRYHLGPGATQLVEDWLHANFDSVVIVPAESEGLAYAAPAEIAQQTEFMVIPRFMNVGQATGLLTGIDLTIKLDFVGRDRSKSYSLSGRGRGREIGLKTGAIVALINSANELTEELRKQSGTDATVVRATP